MRPRQIGQCYTIQTHRAHNKVIILPFQFHYPLITTNIFLVNFGKSVYHSRPVLDCWATFCGGGGGGHPNVHFRCCHCRDSNPDRVNANNKCRRLNDVGHPDPLFFVFHPRLSGSKMCGTFRLLRNNRGKVPVVLWMLPRKGSWAVVTQFI